MSSLPVQPTAFSSFCEATPRPLAAGMNARAIAPPIATMLATMSASRRSSAGGPGRFRNGRGGFSLAIEPHEDTACGASWKEVPSDLDEPGHVVDVQGELRYNRERDLGGGRAEGLGGGPLPGLDRAEALPHVQARRERALGMAALSESRGHVRRHVDGGRRPPPVHDHAEHVNPRLGQT